MHVRCNHVSRILDCDLDFAKRFKYGKSVDSAKFHYLKDCMRKDDFQRMIGMEIGDKVETDICMGNRRTGRNIPRYVSIECVDSGKVDDRCIPLKEFDIEIL